jgi:uncharacterized protein (TIGR03118 family)
MGHAGRSRRAVLARFLAAATPVCFFAYAVTASLPGPAIASFYRVVPLVSDLNGLAPNIDPNLVNPWGVATTATGPFWVADNGTGVSTIYSGSGQPESLVVTIPPSSGGLPPSHPTGLVYNGSSGFEVEPGSPAVFIFATEDGGISGWSPAVNPTQAILKVDNSSGGAIYKGLALALRFGNQPTLYAVDFHNNRIDVYGETWTPLSLPGNFVDPNLPAGFAPFGIAASGDDLLVTYAMVNTDGDDDVPGPGLGFVDLYDTDGNLIRRLITQGELNAPWGVALAPADFGDFSGDLLVGNFGDGRINAFDLVTGDFRGSLSDSTGTPIAIEGLWGLLFGNGMNGGDPATLYFTAGISGGGQVEEHGLLGAIETAGEPTPVLLVSIDAVERADGILLTWNLIADAGPVSFHVYRSDDGTLWRRLDPDAVVGPGLGATYQYLDNTAVAGFAYDYRIAQLGNDGAEQVIGSVQARMTAPAGLSLRADPSPTPGSTVLAFALPRAGAARLDAFDAAGRLVTSIADANWTAGVHRLAWSGVDAAGRHLSPGRYFVRLQASEGTRTVPLTMLR